MWHPGVSQILLSCTSTGVRPYMSVLMSALLFVGINSCMESNKTNLKLLYLGQINQKWSLSSNRHFWTVSIINILCMKC
jgi:hypothetical protein